MCGTMPIPTREMQVAGIELAIAIACRTAEVDYDDFTLSIAAGSYPCLPGAARGGCRCFDETDLLTLYIYGRLVSFGLGALRAGEYACRLQAALKANATARFVSISLTTNGGKRVVVDVAASSAPALFPGKLEFDIAAIRDLLRARIAADF